MTDRKHDADERGDTPSERLVDDASAAFTFELATKPPIKDVASVKAASDMFDAHAEGRGGGVPKPHRRDVGKQTPTVRRREKAPA